MMTLAEFDRHWPDSLDATVGTCRSTDNSSMRPSYPVATWAGMAILLAGPSIHYPSGRRFRRFFFAVFP